MTKRDIVSDLTNLTLPLPEEPDENASEHDREGWAHWADEVTQERHRFEERMHDRWDNQDDYDPLLSELTRARAEIRDAEAHLRLLLAYGREFVEPRPYRLEDLAKAAGMSISGVRTAYDDPEIVEVAKRIGTKLRRRPTDDDATPATEADTSS